MKLVTVSRTKTPEQHGMGANTYRMSCQHLFEQHQLVFFWLTECKPHLGRHGNCFALSMASFLLAGEILPSSSWMRLNPCWILRWHQLPPHQMPRLVQITSVCWFGHLIWKSCGILAKLQTLANIEDISWICVKYYDCKIAISWRNNKKTTPWLEWLSG